VTLDTIFSRVQSAGEFQKTRKQVGPNGRLQWAQLTEELANPGLVQFLPKTLTSRRRGLGILRVARSLADLALEEKIGLDHINRAIGYAWKTFF
jgi:predicted ATPase with chaperone activity